jgi:preprotein translocase subunit SecA
MKGESLYDYANISLMLFYASYVQIRYITAMWIMVRDNEVVIVDEHTGR